MGPVFKNTASQDGSFELFMVWVKVSGDSGVRELCPHTPLASPASPGSTAEWVLYTELVGATIAHCMMRTVSAAGASARGGDSAAAAVPFGGPPPQTTPRTGRRPGPPASARSSRWTESLRAAAVAQCAAEVYAQSCTWCSRHLATCQHFETVRFQCTCAERIVHVQLCLCTRHGLPDHITGCDVEHRQNIN